jgi:hypothetical protein
VNNSKYRLLRKIVPCLSISLSINNEVKRHERIPSDGRFAPLCHLEDSLGVAQRG